MIKYHISAWASTLAGGLLIGHGYIENNMTMLIWGIFFLILAGLMFWPDDAED